MAEVAGTIIGVISLSIQLFDKLSKYTNSVKDARKKAEQITHELDTLVDLLESLETTVSRLDPTTPIALTKTSIHECACAIEVIRARLGDATFTTSSGGFWIRSRNVVKRLAYPFKESDIKYWKEVLTSIQQSLQIALLGLQTDQQQQSFATLQAQLSQMSLETNSGIQMILDQQRCAQNPASGYFIHQNRKPSISYFISQGLYGPVQSSVDLHEQDLLASNLLPTSAVNLEKEMISLRNHERKMKQNLLRWRKTLAISDSCTCHGNRQEKHLLRRPVFLSIERLYHHDRRCSSWLPEACVMNVSFGLILSYLMFGLKLRILMALSIGAGTFSLTPSLICSRIVSECHSIAFKIVASMTSCDPSRRTLRKDSVELSRIFQTRQSSPHDRLENGQTLLHYMCSRIARCVWTLHPSELAEYRTVFKQLLRYMSHADASETDDQGNTCVDLLLGATDPVDHEWNSLVTDLLQHDLKMSMRCHPDASFESYGSWIEIPFETFADPFFGSHDIATTAALLRSEEDFTRLVQKSFTHHILDAKQTVKLYKMMTRMGWVAGCKCLFDAGYDYTPGDYQAGQSHAIPDPFLFDAIESRNQDMVLFWVAVRDNATAAHLAYIGDLETAIVHASETCQQEQTTKILVAHLIKQRCQLREMTEDWGVQRSCVIISKGVLDAHALCAFNALKNQCYQIPPSLRPSQLSVYNVKRLYRERLIVYQRSDDSTHTLQLLYDVGFQEVQGEISHCDYNTRCSPLIFAAMGYKRLDPHPGSPVRFFEIIDWFLSKGASLSECWPGSRTTALHCISAKAALITWARPLKGHCLSKIATTLRHRMFDDCTCSCSKYGCTGITSFWKGSHRSNVGYMADIRELRRPEIGIKVKPSRYQHIGRWELERIVCCVAAATNGTEHQWIVTELIRLFVFSSLGIRHACCNINNIEHRGEPDFKRQPLPRYNLAISQRFEKEDKGLKEVLEKMVHFLVAQYGTYTGSLQSFVDEILLPQTEIELDRLKSEDKISFGVGRRALGVAMVD